MVTKLKPYNPSASDLIGEWHVIDATDQVLGRLATQIAWMLMGKHRPGYVSHLLSGDFVVVTNASKVRTTGNKARQKVYVRHSQYPGHLKKIPYEIVLERHPERIIEHAVKGMLPKTKLGARMLKRLKIYSGAEHPHAAQVLGSQRLLARAAEAAVSGEETAKAPARRSRKPEPAAEAPAEEQPKPAPKRRAAARKKAEEAEAPVNSTDENETPEAAPAEDSGEDQPTTNRRPTAAKTDESGEA